MHMAAGSGAQAAKATRSNLLSGSSGKTMRRRMVSPSVSHGSELVLLLPLCFQRGASHLLGPWLIYVGLDERTRKISSFLIFLLLHCD